MSENGKRPRLRPGRPRIRPAQSGSENRVALVLGGGGLKGFAHIGVLRALEDLGIRPTVFAGTSIGSLIASAYVGGFPLEEMARRATALRRRDLFRLNRVELLLSRARSTSIYLEEPLRELCEGIVPDGLLSELPRRLLVNTVDLERGTQVVWGLPGLSDVSTREAVYSSCALPGFFPPGEISGRYCIDGGTIDNLPAAIAGLGMDAVIAVDVGSSDLSGATNVRTQGAIAIYMRAATVMMHALQQMPLENWKGPPLMLIRPRAGNAGWFDFGNAEALIDEGYRSAMESLAYWDECVAAESGLFPRRKVRLSVIRSKCVGCGICAALAPDYMEMGPRLKAQPRVEIVDWGPADGDFLHHCPTHAIEARRADPSRASVPPSEGEDKEESGDPAPPVPRDGQVKQAENGGAHGNRAESDDMDPVPLRP